MDISMLKKIILKSVKYSRMPSEISGLPDIRYPAEQKAGYLLIPIFVRKIFHF